MAATIAMAMASRGAIGAPPESAGPVRDADAAHSNPTRAECLVAHRTAQELRQNAKLVESHQQLLVCSSASCPGPIVADCGTWISDLEQATPSLAFEVTADGKEATEAKVTLDGAPVADRTHAVKVNPGRHVVRVELPRFEPHEETLFAIEGQRMRTVSVQFTSPKQLLASQPGATTSLAPPPDESAPPRPIPVAVYPMLGVGVAGLAAFGIFGGIGRAKQGDLEQHCEPHCSDSDLAPMKTSYLIGDVSLGVGVAGLVGAAVFYFTRPAEKATPPALTLGVGPVVGAARWGRSWGVSATVGY